MDEDSLLNIPCLVLIQAHKCMYKHSSDSVILSERQKVNNIFESKK